jgi:hypothetical protein
MTTDPQAAALAKARETAHHLVMSTVDIEGADTETLIDRIASVILAEREAERAACEQIARERLAYFDRSDPTDGVTWHAINRIADAIAARKGTL